jgi:hypothetical protein
LIGNHTSNLKLTLTGCSDKRVGGTGSLDLSKVRTGIATTSKKRSWANQV